MALRSAATGIVLAGGRSSRFGGEKLAATMRGAPLLHLAVMAVAAVCEEVLVVGPPGGLSVELPAELPVPARLILDPDPHVGPLAALAHAVPRASLPRVLLAAGDMPDLQATVLRRLLSWDPGLDGAGLVADDRMQPFPLGLDRSAASEQAIRLLKAGERRIRALLDALRIEPVSEAEWRALDPAARTLRDVDEPGDIDAR